MKRAVTLVALAFLILSMLPFHSLAAEIPTEYDEIIYLDNGDYFTVEIGQVLSRGTTVNNNKTYTYRGSNGDEQWRAILYGTFVYDGTTSTCTQGSCDVIITDTTWSVSSKNVVKSGGTVSCDLTMVKKFIGITVLKEEFNLSMTCSPNGVIN